MILPNIEQEVQWLKDSVESIRKDFTKPDDDWSGVMFFWVEDGPTSLMPMMFRDEDEKEFVASIAIPTLIRQLKPWLVGQVHSAWTALVETEDLESSPPPSEHPNREESLILIMVTVEQQQMWSAKIIRHDDKPPTLDPWRLWGQDESTEGRFITPVIETMKEVHGD